MSSSRNEQNKEPVGKTVKEAKATGYGLLKFTDGTTFRYSASDGGYSSWKILRD